MLKKYPVTIDALIKGEERYLYVYLPDKPGKYPVLYMFDGHNVFYDEDATYGKSWGMKEYLDENKIPMIVVAIECNHHDEQDKNGGRLSEYSPFNFYDAYWGNIKARGNKTMKWIVNELKPYIDDNYPTLSDRDNTYIAGSSMGGLMSIYALCKYNDIFSKAAALSPSITFSFDKVFNMIKRTKFNNSVLYMDVGQEELNYLRRRYFAQICSLLVDKKVLLESRIVPSGKHNEASWQKQIPFFIQTLLYQGAQDEE